MPDGRSAAALIAEALVQNGVERIFCVPGESYLALLDALHDTNIAVTVFRHEGAAAFAADAWGKLTGQPGIVMVTRGPGATNASAGLHVARQDSTPVIMFVGQVARSMKGREAFQEVEFRRLLPEVAKWVEEIGDASRAPEFVSRAFHVSTAGRPGPAVLALPEDMLRETTAVQNARPWRQLETFPGNAQMVELQALVERAERPLIILGGSRWSDAAVAGMHAFATRFDLPVGCSLRRQSLFDNEHPNYVGDIGIGPNPELARSVRNADLLLLIGGRMSEMPSSGYRLIDIPQPKQTLVHVHPSAEELGSVYRPDLAINASPTAFVAALDGMEPRRETMQWSGRTRAMREGYLAWSAPRQNPGPLQLSAIVSSLSKRLPPDTIITNGAGNYSAWVHRFFRYRRPGTQLAPTSGTMGYGLPAAIAAKLRHPDRTVVCFAGDGDFQMTGNEFQTAVQYNAPIVVIVVNNGMHGTIRMHQERNYPGRVVATEISSPDYTALARAHGGHGERVERTADFAAAFDRAEASSRASIVELVLDPEAISPSARLSELGTGQ